MRRRRAKQKLAKLILEEEEFIRSATELRQLLLQPVTDNLIGLQQLIITLANVKVKPSYLSVIKKQASNIIQLIALASRNRSNLS